MAKKYVRPFTPAWRWLIAASSVGAFVTGWAILAHTPNPYQTASAASSDAPVTQSQPLPGTRQPPLENTQPNRRQRSFQNLPSQQTLPSQGFGGLQDDDQVQPNSQSQLPTTRTGRQPRLRSGGS